LARLLEKVRKAHQEDTLQELKEELQYTDIKNQEKIHFITREHLKNIQYNSRFLSTV